ncbi:vacuolar import/degradation protein Vid24, partial [Scheffersomyces coipomensis]|uniref:vacuolar import/degradation protein Vid24 n=1 Tax=Scheffersomyces coipomensis TaxID=1788519 RepID=UPI00315D4A3C
YLRPNAQFIGEQQSGKSRFHIKVEFKTVDLLNSTVTGFLQISGLTEDHSEIITCFKGEIINNPLNKYHWRNNHPKSNIHPDQIIRKYSFITENKQWGSYMKNDFEHWKKLINLNDLDDDLLMKRLIKIQNGEEDNQYIYMRWKEEFLLPDSRIKQISGASFDGFYYIVLNIGSNELFEIDANDNSSNSTSNTYNCMIPGSISGLYYHKTSEKFQSLSLRHIDDHGASGSFQFS